MGTDCELPGRMVDVLVCVFVGACSRFRVVDGAFVWAEQTTVKTSASGVVGMMESCSRCHLF